MSTVKALPIPAANVSDGELDTDTESDDEIISEAEEEILEESSAESENESGIVELFKLKSTNDLLQNTFGTIVIPETMVAVDEMMVAFKGRHKLKCFMSQKQTKWGYKLWSLAGVSGYVYNFAMVGENGAKVPPPGEPVVNGVGESGYVVLRLADNLTNKKPKKFFDNYFASPELHVCLKEKIIILFLHSE